MFVTSFNKSHEPGSWKRQSPLKKTPKIYEKVNKYQQTPWKKKHFTDENEMLAQDNVLYM